MELEAWGYAIIARWFGSDEPFHQLGLTNTARLNDAQLFSINDTNAEGPGAGRIALDSKKSLEVEDDDIKVATP